MKQVEWIGHGTWLKADTHTHTTFSDGAYSVDAVVSRSIDNGCDVVAITDHADRNREAGTIEYVRAIDVTRRAHAQTIILAGLEWNIPPHGGDEHLTVLFPPGPDEAERLSRFKWLFDDLGRTVHDARLAEEALRWLDERGGSGNEKPVVIYNHPTRKRRSRLAAQDLVHWRRISDVVIGISGAPGHQQGDPLGAYVGEEPLIDRWDTMVARLGGEWDQLLGQGFDLWGARAPSDFHTDQAERRDFWPGEFSETWLYAPERSAKGALQAFRAGTFFAVHGHVVRQVELTVRAKGLKRPAWVGEVIEVPKGSEITIELSCQIPLLDWRSTANRLDLVQLIQVTKTGASILAEGPPHLGPQAIRSTIEVPDEGVVLRARGRRVMQGEPDLLFYTNPVRVVVGSNPLWNGEGSHGRTLPVRLLGLGIIAAAAIAVAAVWRTSLGRGHRRPHVFRQPSSRCRSTRPVPSSAHFLFGAVGMTLFIAYGSWIPFRLRDVPFRMGIQWLMGGVGGLDEGPGRVDFSSNVLLFIPTSFLWMGAFITSRLRCRTLAAAVPLVVLICVATGLTVEFGQVWIAGRVPSHFDLLAHLLGTLAGIALWYLAGERSVAWLRRLRTKRDTTGRLDGLLILYAVGLIFCMVLPLDLTIHPVDLVHKYRRGQIQLLPSLSGAFTVRGTLGMLTNTALFIPVGILCRRRVPTSEVFAGGKSVAVLAGLCFVVAIEGVQLMVMSRYTDATDLLTGTTGVWIGAVAAERVSEDMLNDRRVNRRASHSLWWLVGAITYALLISIYFCWPMNPVLDREVVGQRMRGMWSELPFHSLTGPSRFHTVSAYMTKVCLTAPFGALSGAVLQRWQWTFKRDRLQSLLVILTGGTMGVAVEVIQTTLPQHTVDLGDAMLCAGGAWLGYQVAYRILAPTGGE